MEQKKTRKPRRVLKNIDFENDNAHLALVHSIQGGPANGADYKLVLKSKYSEDFLEKASQITVTMEITEYLQRFFGIYCTSDAELLARSLGFTTAGMDKAEIEMQEEMLDAKEPPEQPNCWESEPGDTEYEKWINYKLQSIQVMKSLFESENIEKAVLELSEEDYLKVLQDQEIVEKAFVEIEKACKGKLTKPVKKNSSVNSEDTSTNVDVENGEGKTSVVKNKNKGNNLMENEVTEVTIEKTALDILQKEVSETKEQLQKALDLVAKYETEKKEAIAKSRKEQLEKACGKHAEVIFKACGEIQEELFIEVVKALADMQEQINKSAAFEELGVNVGDTEINQESNLAKVIKAKYQKQ